MSGKVWRLDYRSGTWQENSPFAGKFSSLIVSRANDFCLHKVQDRILSVSAVEFSSKSASLLRVRSSGHAIDVSDEGSLTVMIPMNGKVEIAYEKNLRRASGGSALAFGPSRRRTTVWRPERGDFDAWVLKVPLSQSKRHWRDAMPGFLCSGDPLVEISEDVARSLVGLMHYVFSDMESDLPVLNTDVAATHVEALVNEHIRQLPAYAKFEGSPIRSHSASIIRKAEEYMHAHHGKPLTVAEIARSAGVGTRQLQMTFEAETGTSPWQRLTEIRLQNARAGFLTGACGNVTSIAMQCGFVHLGRFSQLYKRTYGEKPSETLRRGRKVRSS